MAQAAQARNKRLGLARPQWRLFSNGSPWGRLVALTTARSEDAERSAGDAAGNDTTGRDGSLPITTQSEALAISPNAPMQAAVPPTLAADYEAFIREHERPILNYLWRMTSDEQAAYDLTQEVFLRAWQRYDAVRRYDQPRSWLFRVATNLAMTHLRRRALPVGAATPLDALLDAGRDPASSDPAWRLAESDLVRRTLLQLSPQRRAALVLREVYGLSAAEVGKALGMTAVAVRMALHRGRAQFRAFYLNASGPDDRQARVTPASPPAAPTTTPKRPSAPNVTLEGENADAH